MNSETGKASFENVCNIVREYVTLFGLTTTLDSRFVETKDIVIIQHNEI